MVSLFSWSERFTDIGEVTGKALKPDSTIIRKVILYKAA